MRKIVIPGEKLASAEEKNNGDHTFVEEGKIVSEVFGVLTESNNYMNVNPLGGRYIPREDDKIIGVVTSKKYKGCIIEFNSAYTAYVSTEDSDYSVGEVILAKIEDVNEVNEVRASDIMKLYDGKLVEMTPSFVPRLIGRKGSMISMIKDETGCTIFVGRNGRLWIKGDKEQVRRVEKAVKKIEEEAPTSGLTKRIEELLEEKT